MRSGPVANVVLMPLSFASNVFVQPRTMPGWLQAFVNVNPVTHLATAARDLMNNTGGASGAVAWSLIATAAITLVFGRPAPYRNPPEERSPQEGHLT